MSADFHKFAALIQDVKVALVTTIEADGTLHTRPLSTLEYEPGGDLWFFIAIDTSRAEDFHEDMRVSVAYANAANHSYVSVSGTGVVLRDRARARQLWTPFARPWFPDGVDDPELALLRVRIEHAQYWTAPGRTAYLLAVAKARLSGRAPYHGENRKLLVS